MDHTEALKVAQTAIRLYAESHPRPLHVNQAQAADMLGISRAKVGSLVKFGTLKLNTLGMIPITEIDKIIQARRDEHDDID